LQTREVFLSIKEYLGNSEINTLGQRYLGGSNMANKLWLELLKEIADTSIAGNRNLVCPKCRNNSIDYQYVGDQITRIGFLDIWCNSCHTGLHMSRVKAPENANMISFGSTEEIAKRIPNFKPVNLSK
jgi:hypothetical protein